MKALRVLLIEDNLIEAYDIKETLEKAGHRVTGIARTYAEATQQAQRYPPDLALVDVILEGSAADGIHTAETLQRQSELPIVFLTANSEHETIQRAQRLFPAAYLLKPFRHAELVIQVELAYHNFRKRSKVAGPVSELNELFLPMNGGYERVDKQNVVYLQALKAYTGIYMTDKPTPHLISMNLGNLVQFFTEPHFHKLSRSVLINLHHLLRIETGQIIMMHHANPLSLPDDSRIELLNKLTLVRTRKPKPFR